VSTPDQTRRSPIFNRNKLKIGTFATNTIGSVHSVAPDAYVPSWENSLRFAKAADRAGLEAILGLARWKNPGNHALTHRGNFVLDSFTWAAALAMATEHIALFATSHAPTIDPVILANQVATMDHISKGRIGLNVVGGWNRSEFDMFGLDLLEHDLRYDYLTEWMTVIFKLWETKQAFDFAGKFLTIDDALSLPLPIQKPHPTIMNAGFSGRGRRFACEYADCCFVVSEITKDQIVEYKRMAREEFGREIGVWMQIPIVQRATRQEARDHLNYFAVEHEDRAAVDGWSAGIKAETRSLASNEAIKHTRLFVATGGTPVIGSAADIADQLEALSEKGVDGILCSWFDFDDGLSRLVGEVFPLLEKRGLRESFHGGK
jgi:FMNH2-dependent dimethyl sulfone monooxygenase